ncbi:hypothetical protein Q0Z83_100760 [Actinoplanes sichuanensis]|nr:hypothetical protein Q0Z83_100760 [Actinoplanes sichuanensis]
MHHVVDANHMGMVETSGAACFPKGPLMQPVLFNIGHPLGWHDLLDGHVAVQHLVAGQPDPAHPTRADRFHETVPTCDEHLPDRHRHPPITSSIRIISHRPPKERRSPGHRSEHQRSEKSGCGTGIALRSQPKGSHGAPVKRNVTSRCGPAYI